MSRLPCASQLPPPQLRHAACKPAARLLCALHAPAAPCTAPMPWHATALAACRMLRVPCLLTCSIPTAFVIVFRCCRPHRPLVGEEELELQAVDVESPEDASKLDVSSGCTLFEAVHNTAGGWVAGSSMGDMAGGQVACSKEVAKCVALMSGTSLGQVAAYPVQYINLMAPACLPTHSILQQMAKQPLLPPLLPVVQQGRASAGHSRSSSRSQVELQKLGAAAAGHSRSGSRSQAEMQKAQSAANLASAASAALDSEQQYAVNAATGIRQPRPRSIAVLSAQAPPELAAYDRCGLAGCLAGCVI